MMRSTLMATRIRSLLNISTNSSNVSHQICRFFQFRDRGAQKRGSRVLCQTSEDARVHHDTMKESKHSVATYNSCEDTIAAIATGFVRDAIVLTISAILYRSSTICCSCDTCLRFGCVIHSKASFPTTKCTFQLESIVSSDLCWRCCELESRDSG